MALPYQRSDNTRRAGSRRTVRVRAQSQSYAREVLLQLLRAKTGVRLRHSDHGSQLAFSRPLEETGILGWMGSVGDALDNAVAESFFATLQTELLDHQSWPTDRGLKTAIF